MCKIIAVTGGKGGTGKSTIATCLARELADKNKVLLVDADVDCPNDHLILRIKRENVNEVRQRVPVFDKTKCKMCGACAQVCKTKAVVALKGKFPVFISPQCNGCGACKIICKFGAISWSRKVVGKRYFTKNNNLHLLSGELEAGEPVSEFVVSELNKHIVRLKNQYDFIIIDTAAGSHCPVIAAIENANKVVIVAEPTPLGVHDLNVILRLLKRLDKKSVIVINKAGIGDEKAIEKLSNEYGSEIILKVPYTKDIQDAYSRSQMISVPGIKRVAER